jgi:hypothetical protein
MQSPWSPEELKEMLASLSAGIDETERERPNARPLPAMTEEEALGLLP